MNNNILINEATNSLEKINKFKSFGFGTKILDLVQNFGFGTKILDLVQKFWIWYKNFGFGTKIHLKDGKPKKII